MVAFSTFENATTATADVVFPLETHAEKDGTVTHPDGRLQRVRPSASRPGDIRPNWGVLAELSLILGHDTGVTSQPSAFAALAKTVPFYAGITDADIGGRGIRWQDARTQRRRSPERRPGPVRRTLSPRRLPPSRRPTTLLAERRPLNRSRPPPPGTRLATYRDLWAGPITELNPPLKFLKPQQRVGMSVADAERLGLQAGDEVSVAQNGTSVCAKVAIKERIPEGICFLIEGTAEGNANALLNGGPVAVDDREGAAR